MPADQKQEIDRLKAQIKGHCDRIAAQSELLSKKAEKESVLIPLEQQSCANCRAWREVVPEARGECRRLSPMMIQFEGEMRIPTRIWPDTLAEDWCAEWIPKPIQQTGEK